MLNIELINSLIKDKYISRRKHPSEDLWIYNYTPSAAYDRKWNDITLMCRGLVLDINYNIVARPFRKFFNIEELSPEIIPNLPFEVYEKMDGSLGIVFFWKNKWLLSTRGSFESEQAVKGQDLLNKYDLSILDPKYSYMFEIIYKENQIVCKYDFNDLVLLAAINNESGDELDIHSGYFDNSFNVVKKYNGITDFYKVKELNGENKEGFVIKFSNNFRMKIKFDEYKRLHKILTRITNVSIWEYLCKGDDINILLEKVPDEFYDWLKNTIDELKYRYMTVQEYAGKCFDNLCENLNNELPNRKEYALWVSKQEKIIHTILFRMYDKRDYSDLIWKIIKPKETFSFKQEI